MPPAPHDIHTAFVRSRWHGDVGVTLARVDVRLCAASPPCTWCGAAITTFADCVGRIVGVGWSGRSDAERVDPFLPPSADMPRYAYHYRLLLHSTCVPDFDDFVRVTLTLVGLDPFVRI